MKNKIIPFLLCTSLMWGNIPVFADETEFNANEAFKSYASFDDSQVNGSWKNYYIVSKSDDDNSKALFSEGEQLTDFIYNSIDTSGYAIIVSQKKDNTEYFGLIDDEDYKELLPVKYKSVENYEVIGYIAENIDGSKEYYIVKTPVNEAPNNVDYDETDKLYILNNYDDLKTTLGINESEPTLTPIEGMDNCYIMPDGSTFYVNIVNEKGEKLVETNFRSVENRLGDYDTLIVHYPEGMNDSSIGLLSKELKTIVPKNFYSDINFITSNNQIYVEAESYIDGSLDYYDLNGNKVNAPNDFKSNDNSYSKWAEESIKNSIELGLVPQNLQSDYTDKITRGEFCQLAVQTYITKTGNEINMSVETPFTDVDDAYITTAYNLKIVSGVGNDKFAPNNYITRQEAAVMLNNLASTLNIDNSTPQSEKFVDESYFADWAKSAIYKVAGIKSGDTYVMTGTGNGKFSPWMNYTREQAVATMYRIYSYKNILSYEENTESTTDSQNKDNITEETSLSEITTSYSKSVSNKEEAEQKISEFLNNNKEITDNISAIDYVGDDKFLVYWGTYSSILEVYQCDYCALVDIKGKYIIPKTDNLIINIGYGKFVEYSHITDSVSPYKGYSRDNYEIYDIDGEILNLEYYDLGINEGMGLTDANIKKVEKQTGENAPLILEASDLGLIPYDKSSYYNQFDWNITNQQFYDFIINLYEIIGGHSGIDTDLKSILSDNNSFDPFEDMTKAKAEKAFSFLLVQLDKKNILDDVFVNKNPECYTIEDTTVTVYNIYKYFTK